MSDTERDRDRQTDREQERERDISERERGKKYLIYRKTFRNNFSVQINIESVNTD